MLVVGLALAYTVLSSASNAGVSEDTVYLRSCARRQTQSRDVSGFIEYPILEYARIAYHRVPVTTRSPALVQAIQHLQATCFRTGHPAAPSHYSVTDLIQRWSVAGALPVVPVFVTPPFASRIVHGMNVLLHSVVLSRKLDRGRLLVPRVPGPVVLKRWKRELALAGGVGEALAARQKPLPRRWLWHNMLEPELVIDWLDATRYIKDLKKN